MSEVHILHIFKPNNRCNEYTASMVPVEIFFLNGNCAIVLIELCDRRVLTTEAGA